MPTRPCELMEAARCNRPRQVVAALLSALALVPLNGRAQVPEASTRPATQPVLLAWHTKLSDALEDAQKRQQPVIAEIGAEWCQWCRQLDQEIGKPQAQEKLANWVRVRLDADRDSEAVRALAVGPIPALRVLTPTGRVVAAEEFENTVRDTADRLASKSPAMMKLGKDAMFRQLDMPLAEALDFLRSQLTIAFSTEDIQEGVRAFFEKREPQWKGR